jgi:hypothetical protein
MGQRFGYAKADAGRRARYNGGLAFEVTHVRRPSP